jgi:hypothetical protein
VSTATEGTRATHEHGRALTLFVASASAAAAAIVVHDLWKSGTVLSAAFSPVFVTMFDELLHRPIDRFEAAIRRRLGGEHEALAPPREAPDRWRRALITGVVAFLIGGLGLTVVELVLKRSLASGADRTTLLGGSVRHGPSSPRPATTPLPAVTQTTTTPGTAARHGTSSRRRIIVRTTTVILAVPTTLPTTNTAPTNTAITLTSTTQTTTAPNGSTTVSTVTAPPPR